MAYLNTFDEFCHSPFWDSNRTWNTDSPDFTVCFKQTILVWLPCAFLWIFLPLEIYYIKHSNILKVPINLWTSVKLIIIALMTFLTFIDVVRYIFFEDSLVPVYLCSSLIKFATFGLFFGLTIGNRRRGITSSGILFLFSFLLVICAAPQFRSEIQVNIMVAQQKYQSSRAEDINQGATPFRTYIIYYPLVVMIFLLNSFSDSLTRALPYTAPKGVCPEKNSSFLSKMLFAWFDRLTWTGYKKPLEYDDLWSLEDVNKSAFIVPKFERNWDATWEQKKKVSDVRVCTGEENVELIRSTRIDLNRTKQESTKTGLVISVFNAMRRTFLVSFIFGSILRIFADLFSFFSPQILSLLIDFVDGEEPLWHGYLYVFLLFFLVIIRTLIMAQHYHVMNTIGFRIKTALTAVIYKKALRISNGARRDFTVGDIVNLMSVDSQQFLDLMPYISMIFSVPVQITIALVLLWNILGPSVLAGLAVMIILVPINGYMASKIHGLQIKQMDRKDTRVKLMNEILSGIKILKLYAWEPSFEKQTLHIRNKELKILKSQAYLYAGMLCMWSAPFLVSLVTFAVYVLSSEENVLNVKIAFVSLTLFNILRYPIALTPTMITHLVKANVSIKRINKFLNSEDLDPCIVSHENRLEPLIIENGSFSWEGNDGLPVLHNIDVRIKAGNLVAVVGPVGAGKSSLISAFLGEMYKISGFVNTKGSIAFVPQQAWVQNATLRDNITFGNKLNESFYYKILEACAMNIDLEMLPGGDLTEIGEDGINLSGGQKQRISLARSVYFDSDIYLLDDPLSAVDTHVGRHIFEHVIGPNGLLKKKTRILVTHSVDYLSEVDYIVVLKDGSVSETGTFDELLEKEGDFAEFLFTYLKETTDKPDDKELKEVLGDEKVNKNYSVQSLHNRQRSSSRIDVRQEKNDGPEQVFGQKLIETELTEIGDVKWQVIAYYLSSISTFLFISTIVMHFLFQAFCVKSNIWLSDWSSDTSVVVNGTVDEGKRNHYLGVYAGLGLGQGVSVCIAEILFRLGCWRSSKSLHNRMLHNIVRLPMSVMDVTPIGRILSRFSKDIDTIDNVLPTNLSDVIYCLGDVAATMFIISYSTPAFLIVIVPLGLLYYFIQNFFVATTRQLKRLESISRSPIYSHFGETLTGAQSIRAYGLKQKFIRQSENKVDFNQTIHYPLLVSDRWLSVRLEILGSLIVFFAALFAVFGRDYLNAGLVGLSVSYSLQITQILTWVVQTISLVKTDIVSVERVKEYEEIPTEAAWDNPNESVPPKWPEKGEVSFVDFKVRYRPGLDLVLKGLTFHVHGGEKIGIVGRTGAGKSSLTLGLFRIIESAGGKILIDGIDISTLGLHTLRSRITIIPQDPVLFSGTLRFNLDPMDKYSDEKIWYVLELVQLKSHLSSVKGLQSEVEERGQNFSVGQRQLICLARALLRKTKVLILDEATASIDLETDDFLQTIIRNEFKDRTVLTIAHRLNTIMDYDRILVLDNGLVVEYDTPSALLNSKNTVFYGLAANSGLV